MAESYTTKNITTVEEVNTLETTDKIFVNDSDSLKQISLSNLMDSSGALKKNQGTENAGKTLVVGSDGNVIPGEEPVKVDSTLTQSGQAADAKVTGDAISSLSEDIGGIQTDIYEPGGKNCIPKLYFKVWHNTNTGKLEASEHTNAYITSPIIPVDPDGSYVCNVRISSYCLYDSKLKFKSAKTSEVLENTPILIPSDVRYISINFTTDYTDGSRIQLEKGKICTTYEPFYRPNTMGIGTVKNENISDGAVNYEKQTLILKKIGSNIYDRNTMYVEKGAWLYAYNNSYIKYEKNEYTVDYSIVEIPVDDSNDTLTISSVDERSIANIVTWYMAGSDKVTPITGTVGSITSMNISEGVTLDIPKGARFLRLSIRYMDSYNIENNLMVNYGSEKKPYSEYSELIYILGTKILTESDVYNIVEQPDILIVPNKIDAVVGDTLEIFKRGILNVYNDSEYDLLINFNDSVDRGASYNRKYVLTPTSDDIGEKTMTISVMNNFGNIISRKSIQLNIVDKPSSPDTKKVVLCVGDSLTVDGFWPLELKRRLTHSDGNPVGLGMNNIEFIGSKEYGDVKFEGYGGWKFTSYLTKNESDEFMNIFGEFDKTESDQHSIYKDDNEIQWKLETIETNKIKIIRVSDHGTLPSSGTLKWVSGGENHENILYTFSEKAAGNPFWNDEKNANDFILYAKNMGVETIDYVYVLLGWNSTGDEEEVYKRNTRQFLDGILDAFPNCKITLMGLEVPSRDGIGKNYGISEYFQYWKLLQFVWNQQAWYQDIEKEEPYIGKVEYMNVSAQFDTEYNMQYGQEKPNIRTTQTIYQQHNGVHPAVDGYYQIADAVFRNISTKL